MKYTQKELLNDSFWDGFKPKNWGKVLRGGVRMGADVLRKVAPELTNPLDNLESNVRGSLNAFKQGYEGQKSDIEMKSDAKYRIGQEVAKKLYDDISINLARQNIKVIPQYGIKSHGVNPKNGEQLYIFKGETSKNPKGDWMVVNAKGNLI